MERAVEFARAELDGHGPVGFNLDRVIAASGISRGSIYHHFGSRAGLITAVETADLMEVYREGLEAARRVVQDAKSGRELMDWLSAAFQVGGTSEGRRGRSRRIATLTASDDIPALHEFLRDSQRDGVAHYSETLEIARDRGLIAPTLPVEGIANLFQSLLVGRVLVDLLDDPEQDARWVETVLGLLESALNPSR